MEYYYHLIISILIYQILSQSFNINFGLGMLFNLAHIASFAIGAYTTALLSTQAGFSFFPCTTLSIIGAALFSALFGLIALRLNADYFAIGTLAFASVVSALLINVKSLTHGVLGIPGIPRPSIAGYELSDNFSYMLLTITISGITQLFLWFIFQSAFARALRAQSESSEILSSLGYCGPLIRNISFAIASACAGLAGSLFAFYYNYIDPSFFSLKETIFIMSIVIIGKPGAFWGCIAACTVLVLIPEALHGIEVPPHQLGPIKQLIYAAILFCLVYCRRSRLFPIQRSV